MPAKKIEHKIDLAKLQKMAEPITVRIVRRKNNSKEPITLPGKNDGAPGTGFSRDDILSLENYILESAGGGYYLGQLTDADGGTIEWEFGWDPRVYPEKVPDGQQQHTASAAAMPVMMPSGGQAIPLQPNPMAGAAPLGNSSWFQAPPQYPYAPPQPVQPQQAWQQPAPAAPPWWAQPQVMPFGGMPGASSPRQSSGDDLRIRQLEESLKQSQQSSLRQDYQAQLAEIQQQSAAQINMLKDELRRMSEGNKSSESDETKRAREEAQRAREDAKEARREQEQKDANHRRREEMTAIQQANNKQFAEMRLLIEKIAEGNKSGQSDDVARLREENRERDTRHREERQDQRHREEMQTIRDQNKGPDPVIEFMKENSRTQAETSKDQARYQRDTADKITSSMIQPIQMIDLLQKQSSGADTVLQSIIGSFGGAFETYRAMMESMVQAQGGGQSAGMSMLQEGLGRFSEMANQYIAYQRDKSVYESQARQAAAQAQTTTAASMRPRVVTPPVAAAAPAAGNGELAGPEDAPPAEADVIDINERRVPTEEEMFGQAMDSVQHLRDGVANGTVTPEQAVVGIMQGVAYCEENDLEVPAFVLVIEERYADLMDILLPEADIEFRAACAQILETAIKTSSAPPPASPPPAPAPPA